MEFVLSMLLVNLLAYLHHQDVPKSAELEETKRCSLEFQIVSITNLTSQACSCSTVAPNASSAGGSATGGLGAATGPSTAGGAGGAKWSAGSRAGWTQQTQGRLITHANSATSDNQNSKQNDDDEVEELPAHLLHNQALYNKRNGTISSRWQNAQQKVPSVTTLSTSLQVRYKSAFTEQSQRTSPLPTAQLSEEQPEHSVTIPPSGQFHYQVPQADRDRQLVRSSYSRSSPRRRHSVSGNSLNLAVGSPRLRRVSVGDAYHGSELRAIHSISSNARSYSIATGASDLHHSTPSNLPPSQTASQPLENLVPRSLPLGHHASALQPVNQSTPTDQQWLEQSLHILSATDNQYTSFYRMRKLLNTYVNSTPSPSTKVVDHMMWGFVMTRPNFESIHGLLHNYQHLLRNSKYKPSPDTYSILITALCQRDINNSNEIELRKSKLDDAMINQRLNQSLPNLSLAPPSSAEDLKVLNTLTSEPNFDHAVQLYNTLSKENLRLLQPAALDSLIKSCSNQSALDPQNVRGQQIMRLNLAVDAFGNLESQGNCSARTYAGMIDVLGYSQKLPNAKVMFDDYRNVRSGATPITSPILHVHHLRCPDLAGLSPELDGTIGFTHLRGQSQPVDEVSDAMVLLSLMRAYLANGDSVSAVTLLEECLNSDPTSATPLGKINSDHILEIISGFIRLSDFRSASKWLKRIFNEEHALYDLDQPGKRNSFLDKIVRLSCQPERVSGGLDVANDAVKVSIETMRPQSNPNAGISLMYRMRQVLNCLLVRALQSSTALQKDHQSTNSSITLGITKDSLEKATNLICDFIKRRSYLLETNSESSAYLLNLQTYGMMENLLNRAIQTCQHIRIATGATGQFKELTDLCQDMLIKLLSHYSTIPDHRPIDSEDVDVQHERSSLAGLLTCYQNLISSTAISASGLNHDTQLEFSLKITTPVIINNMSLILAKQLVRFYNLSSQADQLLRSTNDWFVMLTAGAIFEVQVKEGKSLSFAEDDSRFSTQSILESLLISLENALATGRVNFAERDPAIDSQFLIRVIDTYNIPLPVDGKLNGLFAELRAAGGGSYSASDLRLNHYIQEGGKYVTNRFSVLGHEDHSSPNNLSNATDSASVTSPSLTLIGASSVPSSLPSPLFSPHLANESESTRSTTPPSRLPLQVPHDASRSMSRSVSKSVVPVPHSSFRSFNEHLSQVALSMFCNKDLAELENMYRSVHESASRGIYLTPDASSALIETFGRLGQLDRMREMYVYAHVGLASVEGVTQSDQISRSASWIRVEDRMIIGLSYCGALDELAIHKLRLLENGEAPSADAYAAMIQHARETTDDASVALAYFEEAIQHRVIPNTFLCNTIISKLSKARRAPEALQVFDYMKQNNLPRNSVTFGAIINACCKTGDEKSAEKLFREMLRSKYYKPRIPPFNTMIQLYTQGIKHPNREKVLYYFDEMLRQNLSPSDHTYGFIEPYDPVSMRDVFERACADRNVRINGSHWSTLINVKGSIEKDLEGTLQLFDSISSHRSTIRMRSARSGEAQVLPDAVCYEALFNVLLGLKRTDLISTYVERMQSGGVHMTAYVMNTLIKAHASSGDIQAARDLFESLIDPAPGQAAAFNHPTPHGIEKIQQGYHNNHQTSLQKSIGQVHDPVYREPSSWETMIRSEIENGEIERAEGLMKRMENRAYPNALMNRVRKLIETSRRKIDQ
ncbi:uncharacterized protein MELLADRAFT_79375 [Melampsora larici-populina 98AG31]|uniref:Pentacotripeptide-repeat region of PRORP domain-containing protein n=1 Tax=Melampsora larici-populina (strain 98AG31 / pathotype 3-4-7) TaxID=747676 RepID=F4S644_MELLP|nr:uncharacterized protein MELLADRAFT_79375 [Melampsora larici-populina 98AG31]EGF99907.1 hypothetical protein MELLADRAFT_79375 [Melampsora larici-populina 98AG31]